MAENSRRDVSAELSETLDRFIEVVDRYVDSIQAIGGEDKVRENLLVFLRSIQERLRAGDAKYVFRKHRMISTYVSDSMPESALTMYFEFERSYSRFVVDFENTRHLDIPGEGGTYRKSEDKGGRGSVER